MHVSLLVHFAFATNGQLQLLRQGVDDRNAHAVQTARYFIGVVVELTACVQHGHDHFRSGNALFFVNAGGNATAIILNGNGIIGMNGHDDITTVTGERFVDCVIHDLEYHVVQTGAVIRIADIHTRTFAYRIQPFQNFDT